MGDENYYVFLQEKNGKFREIQNPKRILKKIHSNLKSHLAQIITPCWLKSGKKGVSYLENGKEHKDSKCLLNVDIEGFYPNCQKEYIQDFFLKKFQISIAVAKTIAKLVTYQGFLPTGSPVSQVLAFLAYQPMFEKALLLGVSQNLSMTVYVDDLTFSGHTPIRKDFPYRINKVFQKVGHKIKSKKTKFYFPRDFKKVTGVVLSPQGEIRVPNSLRYKIKNLLLKRQIERINSLEKKSLLGMLVAARSIEPDFFPQVYEKVKALSY